MVDKIRVAVNGGGDSSTIGKRVADAVAASSDMKLVGVGTSTSALKRRDYPLYTATEESMKVLVKKGYDAYILNEPDESLQKVSYSGFVSFGDAIDALQKIQTENTDAWVYRK